MAQRHDIWSYGSVINPDTAWTFRGHERVGRPVVTHDAASLLYYLTCHYRMGLGIFVKIVTRPAVTSRIAHVVRG